MKEILYLPFTYNPNYKRARIFQPQGFMLHSTGANNPNLRRYVQPNEYGIGINQNRNHWNNTEQEVCVHAFIGKLQSGKVACVQTLPWNYRTAHAGSGRNGSANNTHISCEICEDNLSDPEYFAAAYDYAVFLATFLCRKYKWNPFEKGRIIDHSEGHKMGIASGHADVSHWFPRFGKSMDSFRKDVKILMQEVDEMKPEDIRAIVREELATRDDFQFVANCKLAPWAAAAWEEAKKKGITDGTRPAAPITRQEMIVILDRLGLL